MATKPSIPKGTRDFSPVEMVRRNHIFDTIKTVYQKFGFQQIETPTMENLSVLEGKYGEEGDKLLYRILNSGPVIDEIRNTKNEIRISDITEKGLRYDLTVPFARYVVMHQNEITFPFKRYQIQPVWRADRPQKGRYREFYQCDADVIGSDSLLNEVEMIQMIDEVFSKLGIKVLIKINNRKILVGLSEIFNVADKFNEFVSIIDKLDKLGKSDIMEELSRKLNFSNELNEKLFDFLFLMADKSKAAANLAKYDSLNFALENSETGRRGVKEIDFILGFTELKNEQKGNINYFSWVFSNLKSSFLELDLSLARGLNYYTGTIFEVKPNDPKTTFTGSLLGGGRYDDLTGIFGLPNVSGVGISFGVDRIYDVMEEMKLFDQLNLQSSTTQVMFVNFGKEEEKYCLKLLQQVRAAGINAEIYPDTTKKIGKQYSYADAKKIPYVISIGVSEKERNIFKLKNMFLQKENEFPLAELENIIEKIKNKEEI